jgi:Caspase domain
MDGNELIVLWKGKEATLVLKEAEDDEIWGYVGKKHALTVTFDEDDELIETYCHDDLEYDEEELADLLAGEDGDEDEDEDEEDEDEDEEDEDEDDDDDSDEDEEEDEDDEDAGDEEVDEDEDADYGKSVKSANLPGVPTLHAVMVAYGAGIGVDDDVRLMRDFFRTLQDEHILNVKETLLSGADATARNALAEVKGLKPGKDDVVWFSFSGHGCMEEGDRLLCTHGKMLRREAASEAVKKLGARLGVVLSDCCAEEIGRVAPHEKLGAGGRSSNLGERLKKLFRGYRGLFDVTSSIDYQYSFGGVFTPALIKKVLLGSSEDTWEGVLARTTKLVMAEGEGAMSRDGRRALREAGEKVIDAQKPLAYTMPEEVS